MKPAILWPLRLILGAAALAMIHPAPPVQWTATAIAALSVAGLWRSTATSALRPGRAHM